MGPSHREEILISSCSLRTTFSEIRLSPRIDLINCRNLLMYFQRDVQRDVIELFHYALNPEGSLLLGLAETIEASDLFRTVDKKLCITASAMSPVLNLPCCIPSNVDGWAP